jgi:Tripartite tricarboxylate transporter TctB family
MNVLLSKDFLAGNLYMAFGLLGLWLGRELETGSADAMGAGYFPRLVCALLILIGALLAATSVADREPLEPLERGRWRPFACVMLSCLAFALLLHPLGLVLTLVTTTVLARLAQGNIRIFPLLLLCLVLVVANVGIFVIALRIAIPLWPASL